MLADFSLSPTLKSARNFCAIFMIFLLVLFIQEYFSIYVLLPGIILLSGWFWVKQLHLRQAMMGIIVACSGSDLTIYAYCILLLLFLLFRTFYSKKLLIRRSLPEACLLLFFVYGFASYLLSLLSEADLLSYWFYLITFGALTIPVFYFSRYRIDAKRRSRITGFLLTVVIIQCLIAYAEYILPVLVFKIKETPITPDLIKGTLGSANDFAYLCFLVFLINFNFLHRLKINFKKLLILVFIVVTALLASAKTQLFALLIAMVFMILFVAYFIRHGRKWLLLAVGSILIVLSVTIGVNKFDQVYEKYERYITGDLNNKAVYYARAFTGMSRNLSQYLLGTGPGTCGSRAANARAYDVLYKKEASFKMPIFIPPFSTVYTHEILADLWTREYADSAPSRSALLGNPFNSIAALYVEFGLIGFLIFLGMIFFMVRMSISVMNHPNAQMGDKNLAFGLIMMTSMIFITAFVDQILERGTMMYLYWFLAAVVLSTQKGLTDFRTTE